MSDPSSRGSPLQPPAPARAAGHVAATLSDLERKLRELEVELSAVRRHPAADAATRAQAEATGTASGAAVQGAAADRVSPVRLIDERLDAEPDAAGVSSSAGRQAQAPQASQSRPQHSPTAAPPGGAGASPQARAVPLPPLPAHATPPLAQSDAADLVAQVRSRMADVNAQLEGLMNLRRALEHSTLSLRQPDRDAARRAVALLAGHATRPRSVPALTGIEFSGQLEVEAGPFASVAPLAGLEAELATLPGVRGARVRHYDGTHALLDLELEQRVPLGEMQRLLAPAWEIAAAAPARIVLAPPGRPARGGADRPGRR